MKTVRTLMTCVLVTGIALAGTTALAGTHTGNGKVTPPPPQSSKLLPFTTSSPRILARTRATAES